MTIEHAVDNDNDLWMTINAKIAYKLTVKLVYKNGDLHTAYKNNEFSSDLEEAEKIIDEHLQKKEFDELLKWYNSKLDVRSYMGLEIDKVSYMFPIHGKSNSEYHLVETIEKGKHYIV